jgi:transmembrane sensor
MSRETEAAEWFARMCGRDAEKHRAAFDAWMTDPDNAAIYAEANKRWANLDDGSPARILAKAPQPSKPFPLRWATAFVVALALTFGFALYLGQAQSGPQIAASSTAPGNVRLADGTSVELMDGAKVEARLSKSERRVVMTGGRARFTVAHDASRPFRVIAGDSEVIALGTVFEVDLTRANPVIRLVSGSVEVRAPGSGGQAIRLHPGESAEVRDKQPRRIVLSDPKPEMLAPPMTPPVTATKPSRLVVADKLPLSEVINRANRVNSQPIRLADPALGSLEITGRFDVSDSASLARKLSAAFGLSLEQAADGIILTKG